MEGGGLQRRGGHPILSCPAVTALVDMKMGEEEATAWGCDLSYDYVKINADYRS